MSSLKPAIEDVYTTQGVKVGGNPDFARPLFMYTGENAAEKLVRDLHQEAKPLFDEYIAIPKPMLLTATELRSFKNATTCHICTKPLGDVKVRDYCHIVGSYSYSRIQIVLPMLYRQTTSINIWLMVLLIDMISAGILSTILFTMHLIARRLDSSKMN